MLIGFCGLPGAGKSTAAKHLHEEHDFEWINIGDQMKAMLRAFYEWCGADELTIRRKLHGDLKREPCELLNGKTPTHAMQTLGGDWRDLISPELFVDRWADRAARHENVTCDGMRYLDEMPRFRELGGVLVRIIRPGLTETTGHRAENQPLPADIELINKGTVDDLLRAVDAIVTGNSAMPLRKIVRAV